ncbi:DUF1877 family protein [Catellatospora vulcania]|uniref:DUF1877 family protein n=1 Tax=Catellatospora vulcania TaxID=1460450 RepID=UPI0018AF8E0E|nr:DUF1877 family protein [Catellatospora vulcania]
MSPLHFVVSHNPPAEVRDVATALSDLDMDRFVAIYRTIDPEEYGVPLDDGGGLEYLTSNLADVTAFYLRAAEAGWVTPFVVDQ